MWIASALGVLGNVFTGIFSLKKEQGQAIQAGLKVLGDAQASNGQREQAVATIIASENSSGFWLASIWRPLTAVILLLLVVLSFFGYEPPGMTKEMSPMMKEIFELLKICIMGYIPARSFEKIISSLSIGKVLNNYISKKLL